MEIASPEEYRRQYQQEIEQDKQNRINGAWGKTAFGTAASAADMSKYSAQRANGAITTNPSDGFYYSLKGAGFNPNPNDFLSNSGDEYEEGKGKAGPSIFDPNGYLTIYGSTALDAYDNIASNPYAYEANGDPIGSSSGSLDGMFGGEQGSYQQSGQPGKQNGVNPITTNTGSHYGSGYEGNMDVTQYNNDNLYNKYKQQQEANKLALRMGGTMYG